MKALEKLCVLLVFVGGGCYFLAHLMIAQQRGFDIVYTMCGIAFIALIVIATKTTIEGDG